MYIASAEVVIEIPEAYSLKDRRRVLDSLITVMGKSQSLAVADFSRDGEFSRARFGMVAISNSFSHAVEIRESALRALDRDLRFEVIEIVTEEVNTND
jgi:hypothetical protein